MAKINIVYFSPMGSTLRIAERIANAIGGYGNTVDLCRLAARDNASNIVIDGDSTTVIAVPVYAGRVPALASEQIKLLQGNGSCAILAAVYGNREFDDALVELYDLAVGCGFKVAGAGAFIARHSIFPIVARKRPDKKDFDEIDAFSVRCAEIIKSGVEPGRINVKGNRPYRPMNKARMLPAVSESKCVDCKLCEKECPAHAIANGFTNPEKCIACGHCIAVCKHGARSFSGMKYRIASFVFWKKFHDRRNPYTVFPE